MIKRRVLAYCFLRHTVYRPQNKAYFTEYE